MPLASQDCYIAPTDARAGVDPPLDKQQRQSNKRDQIPPPLAASFLVLHVFDACAGFAGRGGNGSVLLSLASSRFTAIFSNCGTGGSV